MNESIYRRDEQGRLILAGERGEQAMAIAQLKLRERAYWARKGWGYPDSMFDHGPEPELPQEPLDRKELNSLWQENTRLRETQRRQAEQIRGLTQRLAQVRPERQSVKVPDTKRKELL